MTTFEKVLIPDPENVGLLSRYFWIEDIVPASRCLKRGWIRYERQPYIVKFERGRYWVLEKTKTETCAANYHVWFRKVILKDDPTLKNRDLSQLENIPFGEW